ncbi:MAG: hypothetical protein FAF04_02905 [Epsilonproteobacteria bacterium]|nr:hypothetical protein [Campylobacterota bacterium]
MFLIYFQSATLKDHTCKIISNESSYEDGVGIAQELFDEQLKGIFVLSDGLQTNGSKLTEGISSVLPSNIVVSGGLAGDKDRFEHTWIIENGKICESVVCAIGFYGENIHFQAASKGGWDSLGLTRVVTKSKDNVAYEFDGKLALEIYKRYLGDKVKELPASALLFPLGLKDVQSNEEKEIRTAVLEEN